MGAMAEPVAEETLTVETPAAEPEDAATATVEGAGAETERQIDA
jgi:small subunit ribosomal protein S2